tara:strand:- start:725 stop:1366 length:642 start_codon:yes stop_codon:yes gene_type:complete
MTLEEALAENARLTAKISESNKHTKAAEAATAAAALKAAEDEKERLKATNNNEQLVKTLEAEGLTKDRNHAALLTAHALEISEMVQKSEFTIDSNKAREFANEISKCGKRAPVLADKMKPFLKHVNGKSVIVDKDGNVRDITPEAFILEFKTNPAYDFLVDGVDSSGGSATGSSSTGGATANPFKRGEHFNLTKQGEIIKSDPALAAQLKASA